MSTDKILFICGGAFVGIDKIIEKRRGKKVLGFGWSLEPGEMPETAVPVSECCVSRSLRICSASA